MGDLFLHTFVLLSLCGVHCTFSVDCHGTLSISIFQGQSMYPGAGPMGGMPPNQPGQHGMGPSPMNSPMQQQRRIDPDQMPSPVSAILFLLFIYFF